MCIPSRVVQHQLLQLKPHQRNQMERLPNNHAAPHHREYLAQGYNGGRQSDIYITDRKNMVKKIIKYIIKLIKRKKQKLLQPKLNKVTQMAQRLEHDLYKTAPDCGSYKNPETLKQRLKEVSIKIQRLLQQHKHAQVQLIKHGQNLTQGYNGEWQSDRSYLSDRHKMIKMIFDLIKASKPNATKHWLNKLPRMTRYLEFNLFRTAPDFESYNNSITVRQRLQQIATNMYMKKHQQHHHEHVEQVQQSQDEV